jgi:hypothetical protein
MSTYKDLRKTLERALTFIRIAHLAQPPFFSFFLFSYEFVKQVTWTKFVYK